MFQQRGHVVLDLLELVQPQIRIGNCEHITGPGMLINEYPLAIADDLLLHLEHAFAFEHHGQNEHCRRVSRVILFDKFAQQRFGGLAVNRVRGRRGGFVNALPVGNESFALPGAVAELVLPAGFANVHAAQMLGVFIEKQRVQWLFVGKRQAA